MTYHRNVITPKSNFEKGQMVHPEDVPYPGRTAMRDRGEHLIEWLNGPRSDRKLCEVEIRATILSKNGLRFKRRWHTNPLAIIRKYWPEESEGLKALNPEIEADLKARNSALALCLMGQITRVRKCEMCETFFYARTPLNSKGPRRHRFCSKSCQESFYTTTDEGKKKRAKAQSEYRKRMGSM